MNALVICHQETRLRYAIYPPIGFARVGNSPDSFFVGPEQRNSLGIEINPDGNESPVTSFKDQNYRMKRQAARFHLYEVADREGVPKPAVLPEGATVRWSVTIKNKKDAVVRPGRPPNGPRKVKIVQSRIDRLISATAVVEGVVPVSLDGTYQGHKVNLGNIRTDKAGRLIVLGGYGRSETFSSAPIGASFYNNPDWFDDVGDGLVCAKVTIPGQEPVDADSAWVIIGPPDFAPVSLGIVTLYDVIYQIAIERDWIQQPDQPFFETDIRPLIERASNLQWVHSNSVWPNISRDWAKLSSPEAADQSLRSDTSDEIRQVEGALQYFELMDWQLDALDAWTAGSFNPGAAPSQGAAYELTRSALDGTVGASLHPGIEAGINISNPLIFLTTPFEFRFDPKMLESGDMTALMALPWQADFLKCASGWWPAQRPNHAPQETGAVKPWLRPTLSHKTLIDEVMKLGVIGKSLTGKIIERERDPRLGD